MKNIIRIPSQSFIGNILRLPLRLIPKQATFTVRSGLNKGVKWVVGSSIHGCWLGHYELDKQQVIQRFVKPGMNVLDIGANAGFYTLAASRLVGKNGHVWAFEPFAENANNLLRHLHLNDITNVTMVQAVVSDAAGVVGFNIAPNNAMGSISEETGGYQVPSVALDDLLAKGILPVPDVIKMDVEGAESRVLDGSQRLLRERKSVLLIALHGNEQKRACLSILKRLDYSVFLLNGERVTGHEALFDEIYAVP